MQAQPRPEDLVAGLAMAEHEGAVYEDSMVRCFHCLRCGVLGLCEDSMVRCFKRSRFGVLGLCEDSMMRCSRL